MINIFCYDLSSEIQTRVNIIITSNVLHEDTHEDCMNLFPLIEPVSPSEHLSLNEKYRRNVDLIPDNCAKNKCRIITFWIYCSYFN